MSCSDFRLEGATALEHQVMEMLLAGDNSVLDCLRRQASSARVSSRENTGVGFFCDFELPADAPTVTGAANFELGDVDATIEGLEYGAGFLLFVRKGRMTMLEGYSYEEPWPSEVRHFTLTYRTEPRELPPELA